jgi:hypothetical protein
MKDEFNSYLLQPTISNLIRGNGLFRNEGYTTNKCWLIKSEFENKNLSKKNIKDVKLPLHCLFDLLKYAKEKMETTNILHTTPTTITVDVKCQLWTSRIDAYFLSYVLKNVRGIYEILQKDENSPLFFVNDKKEILAIIMPVFS